MDGYRFDSLREAAHYQELKLLLRAGEISGLGVHPQYPIVINDQRICTVELDFFYTDKDGAEHVVDVKGLDTPVSRLKRKMVEAVYGIKVEVVK